MLSGYNKMNIYLYNILNLTILTKIPLLIQYNINYNPCINNIHYD